MRLPLLIITACSGFVLSARAQAFEPGFVVTTAGDTLRGEVENSYWEANPTSIRFRAAASAPVSSYSPTEARAFQLRSGRYFRTELLPLSRGAETRTPLLQRYLSTDQKQETVFAEVLVEGAAPLLRYVLPGATHYFVRRENQPYIELTERKHLGPDRSGRLVIVDANTFRIQLQQFFGDCPAAVQQVAKASFTARDLAAVVQTYNQSCSAAGQAGPSFLVTNQPAHKLQINAGPLTGVQFQSIRLQAESPGEPYEEAPVLNGTDLGHRPQPVLGVYADVLMPNRRLALHSSVLFSQLGQRGTTASRGNVPAAEYRWKGHNVAARLGVRYFVPVGARQQLFLGGGLTLDWFTITESSLRYGDGQPRQVAGVSVPGAGRLLGLLETKNPSVTMPYLETGLRRGRFTVSVDARFFGDNYGDELTVSKVWRDNQGRVYALDPNRYVAKCWFVNGLLAYRLTKNRDAARSAAGPASR
ncbi:hypothetical protein [Hymenobacter chitinivorans]|uniref:Uncharacterized protein n=1 Tax=Hymenobacter chitinivorans DSM 11115 TaxID=1121954 RepID=A0A2M9BPI7_9BACT|nr:hypothetical protein [Hymenobacter chitinivorans]PJJ59875.1 hypothetical protein CLV45_1297 [Hymenobacter chitinivorans DSM 11115]